MTLRKWFYLFWTTLLVGAGAAVITGLILQLGDQEIQLGGKEIGFSAATMLLGGATISVLSQMGFFAYLIFRYIAMGMIRNKWTWNMLQGLVILIVMFDLIYLRYSGSSGEEGWAVYLILPIFVLVAGVAVAWWKVRLTNAGSWMPTLFFMIAVTAIEAVPSLRLNNAPSTVFMMVPLMACNAWQILILSKVVNTNKEP
ncbi:KinB-signaling pathway activation protein [Paenibacillus mucilaginosus]|uniref:KinB signaling pathway activation protein n=1 Tax=Paenibacillus mucilaginosus (strain KNP414) TaxID=1036673 RepID=F8F7H6_PAEMK|nr:KinB-signaling pathway activation protein [Paenibacillus mucilaginosus]AEI45985.1 KinB signaling pathway activation protein [Paenibacillus mucilaginosus KNP414]MCG7217654.1 KinB-signaling pathway activation protein [Paenibacillus mucilaginosus]WDM27329.1 KinB-signaling pathway activation protein [Paenibacillus mucilaginosus]